MMQIGAIEAVAAFEGRLAKVEGPARSGKTEALVRRCARVVEAGADPASVLVAVSTAFAADAFRARLAAALGEERAEAARAVRVECALDAIVRTLGAPEAVAATGRVPRLLMTGEYNLLLEDMKTLGTPVRKLRAMLGYFYRLRCDLVPRKDWGFGGAEETVWNHLVGTLSARKSMLAQEAGAVCAEYLQSDAGAPARGAYAIVLADDFQNLSRAEQTCLCLLARDQIVVAGNVGETVPLRSGRPHPEGFARFDALRRGVETFSLPEPFGDPAVAAFAGAITARDGEGSAQTAGDAPRGDGGRGGVPRGVVVLKWRTPDEEAAGVASYLRALLDADEGLLERDVCVLVPNRGWGRLAARALSAHGLSSSTAGVGGGFGGSYQDSERAKAFVAYTRLCLAADPADVVAWRSWCGFDNHLANSEAWESLAAFARERGIGLYEALRAVGEGDPAAAGVLRRSELARRWESGRAAVAESAGRRGFALLRAVGAENLPEFAEARRRMEGDEGAAEALAIVRESVEAPTFPAAPHDVRIATYDAMPGTGYRVVIAVAAVDGLMPPRDAFETVSTDEARGRVLSEARRAFSSGVAKADELLVVSTFSKAPLELAERTKMQVTRVRAENGERVAAVRPTAFLAEAGAACPATTGGQAALATFGR